MAFCRKDLNGCFLRAMFISILGVIFVFNNFGLPLLLSKLGNINPNVGGNYLPLHYIHGDVILSAGESKSYGPTTLKLTEEYGLQLIKGRKVIWSPELKLSRWDSFLNLFGWHLPENAKRCTQCQLKVVGRRGVLELQDGHHNTRWSSGVYGGNKPEVGLLRSGNIVLSSCSYSICKGQQEME